ncbi:hypothetical protein HNQ80_002453 [Anaerosolibacter carboniphilus]|uniref:TATA-box binding protein n=1 Tax=Anaerosolibacter carboniphilus TaxID=1417629 RepID=A0A841KSH9_9FIRM|nr:YwmB family TATA-box binding protein [Anaerosolibacter carboniphilus]MBB6216353.1 hypothetical protein [Anaerosolibacter carboniphilus]
MFGNQILKKRKTGLYFLIIMYLVLVPFYQSKAGAKEIELKEVLKTSGAQLAEYNVNAHVGILGESRDMQEAENLCWDLSRRLGMKKAVMESNHSKENVQTWVTGKYKGEQDITVMVQSSQTEAGKETNIVVDLMGKEKLTSIQEIGKELKAVLGRYGDVELSSWVSGTFPGKKSKEEQMNITSNIMASLEAKEIEGIREDHLISIVGYSKMIPQWIRYGGKKVNLNIALRYNSYEDKTYLWIGNPLISIAY